MSGVVTTAAGAIDVLRLPCMPIVLQAAMELASDPRTQRSLVTTIALDPTLTSRFVATTAPGASADNVFSFARHIERLGNPLVQSVLMRAATDTLHRATRLPVTPDGLALWAHSLHCAYLSRSIAEACAYSHPDEAYMAGLLHDIGILSLATDLPHTYAGTFAASQSEAQLLEGELDQLHTSHAEAGAMLMARLGMPGQVGDAVLLHHAGYDELAGTHKLVRILWIAEACTDRRTKQVNLQSLARLLSLTPDGLARALAQAGAGLGKALKALRAPAISKQAIWHLPTPAVEASASNGESWEKAADSSLMNVVMQSASLHQVPNLLIGAEDTATVLARIRSIASALFGLDRYVAFMHDPSAQSMIGWLIAPDRLAPIELEIPMSATASLIARAAAEKSMLQVPGSGAALPLRGVDLQIGRLLKARALIVVPMLAGSAVLGVLVFGAGDEQAARLALDAQLLRRLTEITTRVLADRKINAEQRRGKEGELRERFRNSARRLVHEARNPLTVMKTQLELLGDRVRSGQPIEQHIHVLRQEIDRVTDIVGKIGTADLGVDKAPGAIDINALVREMMGVYREALFVTRAIDVELLLDRRAPNAIAETGALKQVLLFLWKNASEAMTTGGRLRVRSVDRVNYEGKLMVELSISDSGRGMPPEIVENLFSQRLSTIASDDRGFGLSNTLTLIKQLNGHLLCRSDPELGTTFILLLPRAAGAEQSTN
jgi:signal transduction histidine kinase/HD-like signal output (HDOD) protein